MGEGIIHFVGGAIKIFSKPFFTKQLISHYLPLLLITSIWIGCSKTSNSGAFFDVDSGHSAQWINPAYLGTDKHHAGPITTKEGIKPEDCTDCHGRDLDGGISSISCFSCHNGPFDYGHHPDGWVDNSNSHLHFHGYYGQKYTISCTGCHGQRLSGQIAKSCFTCHAYESNWNSFGVKSTTLSGLAANGLITNGHICVYEITDYFGNRIGEILGSTITDLVNGAYTVDLDQYRGHILLTISDGQYKDEATGIITEQSSPLRAVTVDIVGAKRAVITPLTEIAYRLALDAWDGLTKENILWANALVADKLLGADIITTFPILEQNNQGEVASQSEIDYGLLLGIISQMGLSKQQAEEEIIDLIFEDLVEDNQLDQTKTSLQNALNDFFSNSQNHTGIYQLSQTQLDEVWSRSSNIPNGEKLYTDYCARCHGQKGNGTGKISSLGQITAKEAIRVHAWIQDTLTEAELQAIVDYLAL